MAGNPASPSGSFNLWTFAFPHADDAPRRRELLMVTLAYLVQESEHHDSVWGSMMPLYQVPGEAAVNAVRFAAATMGMDVSRDLVECVAQLVTQIMADGWSETLRRSEPALWACCSRACEGSLPGRFVGVERG